MGLSIGQIGQIPGNRNGPRAQSPIGGTGLRTQPPRTLGLGQRQNETPGANLLQRGKAEPIRAGFGRNTITIPGVTVLALRRTVGAARSLVPSFQELRARLRENAENSLIADNAEQANIFQRDRDPALRQVETRRLDPAAQARNFINTVNDAAGLAESRLQGNEPEDDTPRATIQINGESFDFTQAASEQRLNIFA